MNASQWFVRSTEISWDVTGEGVRRQVLGHGTELMVVRVEFQAGAEGALHHHPHRQATYVAAGRFDVTVGDETSELVAGDCFYAAADVVHGVRALERGALIDVFTPVREDFLMPGLW
ncbi:MAG: Cupin 2 conserved barrel domain protein [Gemmatimonadetes bacterium]|nr:Cupin 2 conserved barrel domain protein [Gemmatimonadota bacterium]